MNQFWIYLLKSGIALWMFFGIYWIFLRKETFFSLNRSVLLDLLRYLHITLRSDRKFGYTIKHSGSTIFFLWIRERCWNNCYFT